MKHILKESGAFELKQTETNSIPFSDVLEHQVNSLLQSKHGVLVFKIPDVGYRNPFDSFCLSNMPAYVVIKYPDFNCMIDIDDWVHESTISKRRSLTDARAKEIASILF